MGRLCKSLHNPFRVVACCLNWACALTVAVRHLRPGLTSGGQLVAAGIGDALSGWFGSNTSLSLLALSLAAIGTIAAFSLFFERTFTEFWLGPLPRRALR